ncbi:type II toxin-antitoxin system RelE/ParE family toxin [Azospirillum sp. SYSU D00513]|uniref:type II toxin-antitoxin system RelE/ParE family toxin n=1 Tax=Azospirillum sp. SYSU D00513 TaxID=2812561 RepID=UPI001A966679|nr:type II toxin-antitoxin system RelE/ParE family toxin [Azospirillum sp. SYSU D00513]
MHAVLFHAAFATEFRALPQAIRIDLAAAAKVIGERGPSLGRPHVDTLNGSKHANMKELRFRSHGGVWRVAFAFDPKRNAILLVAGDKSGVSEKRFYSTLVATADRRYDDHLADLKKGD